jgi:hypothetical protein
VLDEMFKLDAGAALFNDQLVYYFTPLDFDRAVLIVRLIHSPLVPLLPSLWRKRLSIPVVISVGYRVLNADQRKNPFPHERKNP